MLFEVAVDVDVVVKAGASAFRRWRLRDSPGHVPFRRALNIIDHLRGNSARTEALSWHEGAEPLQKQLPSATVLLLSAFVAHSRRAEVNQFILV